MFIPKCKKRSGQFSPGSIPADIPLLLKTATVYHKPVPEVKPGAPRGVQKQAGIEYPDAGREISGLRFKIAGERGAANLGITNLGDAERMEKDGASRENIWRKTGWWCGRDGKWRVEMPDIPNVFSQLSNSEKKLLATLRKKKARTQKNGMFLQNAAMPRLNRS